MSINSKEIHVMLVDDSAVIRGGLTRILESKPHIKIVKSVADGQAALDALETATPHVVILDIEMPVMDGLTALPKIIEASPDTKVVMFSSLTEKGATATLKAFELGAVECVAKPSSSSDVGEGSAFQRQLVTLIEGLVPVDKRHDGDASQPASTPAPAAPDSSDSITLHKNPGAYLGKPKILAIGSSTGGPQALFEVLKHCNGFDIPIVITQHMPATFTRILAEHIQQQTGIEAHEGAEGMVVEAGKAYVAPGGLHMIFEEVDGQIKIKLDDGPQVNYCKPAVDPMFDSIINIHGQQVLGAILTGMGADGLGGGQTLVKANGRLIAQDEATSVVWGMPGAVAQAGICCEVLPLSDIGPWLKKAIMG